jgi:hypothetical protein
MARTEAALAADPVIAAVGDSACASNDVDYNGGNGTATRCRQRYVSDLLVDPMPDALLDLGDNQYVNGTLAQYQSVYDATFGRANAVVYPSLGNAEYGTPGAKGFFDYFGATGVTARITGGANDASHFPVDGYYSFDLGAWHVIALNSNCTLVAGGCAAGSAQEQWLRADLKAHANLCTLAYWHHPRWNSGLLGNDASTSAFWTALHQGGADVVLNGHGNHHYERFTPQSPAGTPDPTRGIREFMVGTGGESHGTVPVTPGNKSTSEITDYTSFGVLRMTLRPADYDWSFVPAAGGAFTDSGSDSCHAASVAPAAPAVSASRGDGVVALSWQPPADGGATITGYRIYRGTSTGGESLLGSVGQVTEYRDTAVTNGVRYFYRVAAVNAVGEGQQSAEVSAIPRAVAYPSTGVLDDFGRAAGLLGEGWQSPGLSDSGTVSIVASGETASSAGAGSATWSGGKFGADQEAYLAVAVLPRSGNWLQVAGRVSNLGPAGISCYFLRVTPSTGTWDLRKKLNGATSTSLQTFTAPLGAGDSVGLRISGSVISAYRRAASGAWSSVGSTSDAAITAGGYVTFTLGDTTMRGGAFGGGAIGTTAYPSTGVLDDFGRAAGLLGEGWQSPGLSDSGTVSIVASGETASSAGAGSATWSGGKFGADQEAYLAVAVLPRSGNWLQVAGRVSNLGPAGISCYFLRVTPSTGTWDLRKKLNGATSTSLQTFTAPLGAGDSVGLRISGSVISAYRRAASGAWSSVGSTSDAAITAGGYVTFTLGDTTMRGGAFGGGTD